MVTDTFDDRPNYSFRIPRSAILETNITKAAAWRLIAQGFHPRRAIWCPGSFGERPEFGDLYAPDEDWQPARPILSKDAEKAAAEAAAQRERSNRYGPDSYA